MAKTAQKSGRQLLLEIQAANALREALRAMTDDDEAIRDTIEGATDLHAAITAVEADIREDEIFVRGADSIIETLTARKTRFEDRIARRRAAIEQAMVIGELRTLELPDATITLKAVPPKVEITDESKIPAAYWKQPEPALDKSALKAALKDNIAIPGAQLGNGSVTIQIRRS